MKIFNFSKNFHSKISEYQNAINEACALELAEARKEKISCDL